MKREYAFQKAPRCKARSKRSGNPCQSPAVNGWAVCRFHGAKCLSEEFMLGCIVS